MSAIPPICRRRSARPGKASCSQEPARSVPRPRVDLRVLASCSSRALCYDSPMRGAIRIVGIDPGLRRTGWGVIDTDGVKLGYVACGTVCSDADGGLGMRLRQLFDGLSEVLVQLAPVEAAVRVRTHGAAGHVAELDPIG